MPAKCPGCGTTGAPEARFCRRCGAPLKAGGGQDTLARVSPVAQTVPLAEEGRATDGLAAEESQRLGEDTSRIRRAEMDDLLRRIARDHGDSLTRDGDGLSATPLLAQGDGSSEAAPAVTSGLNAENAEIVENVESASLPQTKGGVPAQTESGGVEQTENAVGATPAQALSAERSGFKWKWAAAILLCVVLGASALAVISIRRSRASGESSTTATPASEEPQPVAAETGAPQIEPLTVESPPPANTPAQAPLSTQETEAAAHPSGPSSPAVASVSPAPPTPAPTPDARQKTTPQPPTPPALSATDHYQRGVQLWATNRRAALEEFRAAVPAVPDAYYYLGSEYYSEGRDIKTLSDGELRAALNYFLRATTGPHSGQASRSAQLLGKEYERRKKKQTRP